MFVVFPDNRKPSPLIQRTRSRSDIFKKRAACSVVKLYACIDIYKPIFCWLVSVLVITVIPVIFII